MATYTLNKPKNYTKDGAEKTFWQPIARGVDNTNGNGIFIEIPKGVFITGQLHLFANEEKSNNEVSRSKCN